MPAPAEPHSTVPLRPHEEERADDETHDERRTDDREVRRGILQDDVRLAEDPAGDDRVPGYRRDEELLAEVVLAVDDERDHPHGRALEECLRVHAGEREREEVEARRAPEARRQRAAERADEDERE